MTKFKTLSLVLFFKLATYSSDLSNYVNQYFENHKQSNDDREMSLFIANHENEDNCKKVSSLLLYSRGSNDKEYIAKMSYYSIKISIEKKYCLLPVHLIDKNILQNKIYYDSIKLLYNKGKNDYYYYRAVRVLNFSDKLFVDIRLKEKDTINIHHQNCGEFISSTLNSFDINRNELARLRYIHKFSNCINDKLVSIDDKVNYIRFLTLQNILQDKFSDDGGVLKSVEKCDSLAKVVQLFNANAKQNQLVDNIAVPNVLNNIRPKTFDSFTNKKMTCVWYTMDKFVKK